MAKDKSGTHRKFIKNGQVIWISKYVELTEKEQQDLGLVEDIQPPVEVLNMTKAKVEEEAVTVEKKTSKK
jgi:hypothetical protein